MKKIISTIFTKKSKPTNDFSAFFKDASSGEKKRVIMKAVRKSNEDQKALVEKYKRLFPHST